MAGYLVSERIAPPRRRHLLELARERRCTRAVPHLYRAADPIVGNLQMARRAMEGTRPQAQLSPSGSPEAT